MDVNGKKETPRALGLFSGGLDSMLAALLLRRNGVEVEVVTFASPFFSPAPARASARRLGLKLRVVELGGDYLDLVRNPPRGRGRNMNPCVDCHAFMLGKAGEIMQAEGFDFLFTGEVLGQRPFSQNKGSLNAVANDSGYRDRILRPLSAQLLPPTPMEESGLVDREQLLAITGRGRKEQMALAQEWGIGDYPTPAGGCLLTEPGFSRRLSDLWENDPGAGAGRIEVLKHGRQLRLSPRAVLVVGRNQAENQRLEAVAPAEALQMRSLDAPGPLGLYLGPADGPELQRAAAFLAGYGKAKPGQMVRVETGRGEILQVKALDRLEAADLLL